MFDLRMSWFKCIVFIAVLLISYIVSAKTSYIVIGEKSGSIDIDRVERRIRFLDVRFALYDCSDPEHWDCFKSDVLTFAIPKNKDKIKKHWIVDGNCYYLKKTVTLNIDDKDKSYYIVTAKFEKNSVNFFYSYEDGLQGFEYFNEYGDKRMFFSNTTGYLYKEFEKSIRKSNNGHP